MDPSDAHDLRNTEEAAIETAHLAIEGFSEHDSLKEAANVLKKIEGVRDVHCDNAGGTLAVTFDARITHVPALHDALLGSGYQPARTAKET
jgi:copper chaperone CopZ